MDKNRITNLGKGMLVTVSVTTAAGGFIMDMNRTHMFNPNWPPHAKFHDALSITLGTLLGSSGLYFLLRKSTNPVEDVKLGTILPLYFWIGQGLSFAFPGAKGIEAEFPELAPRIGKIWLNEGAGSALMLCLSVFGYALETRRIDS